MGNNNPKPLNVGKIKRFMTTYQYYDFGYWRNYDNIHFKYGAKRLIKKCEKYIKCFPNPDPIVYMLMGDLESASLDIFDFCNVMNLYGKAVELGCKEAIVKLGLMHFLWISTLY